MSSVLSTILTDLSKQNCPTHSPSERAAMTDNRPALTAYNCLDQPGFDTDSEDQESNTKNYILAGNP